jgi:hypothetical protein
MSFLSNHGENSLDSKIKRLKEKRKELQSIIRNYVEKVIPNTPFYKDR